MLHRPDLAEDLKRRPVGFLELEVYFEGRNAFKSHLFFNFLDESIPLLKSQLAPGSYSLMNLLTVREAKLT